MSSADKHKSSYGIHFVTVCPIEDIYTMLRIKLPGFVRTTHGGGHPQLGNGTRWRAVPVDEKRSRSDYARDHPEREDIAESFLPYTEIKGSPPGSRGKPTGFRRFSREP